MLHLKVEGVLDPVQAINSIGFTSILLDTHLKTGFSNTTSGSISFPFSSLALQISRVDNMQAITIHTDDSTRCEPGHLLLSG